MRTDKNTLAGFTLIELMLSMVFGLIVLSGLTSIYLAVVTSSSDTLKNTKLNSQLMTIMGIMADDIRRAGYWSNSNLLAPTDNPFNQVDDSRLVIVKSVTDKTKIVEDSNIDGSCILYSYDRDEDGLVDNSSSRYEYYGFRLNGGTVQVRSSGSVTQGDSCTNGNWYDLSDDDLYQIDTLTFNPRNSSCANSSEPDGSDSDNDTNNDVDDESEKDCYRVAAAAGHVTVETREILITLGGSLKNDANVKAQYSQSIRVRNDLVRVR
ncbi:PulJ/GspJ family protein [Thalassotalea sp. ND16A]|uniref:PulJ/GspJ family protein n=1 Tax=Thalassotalea sp. ND16A TaxID=1535422 RepID=UPI00051A122F|nr:hypothetical protein [Thalassotalea sp. ND16A]KGJ88255.1 hypothetical protein ND16A_0195 [Thalassotalea sp. ND16A]